MLDMWIIMLQCLLMSVFFSFNVNDIGDKLLAASVLLSIVSTLLSLPLMLIPYV